MELFKKLGEQIEEIWRERNYNEEEFPDLAAAALKEAHLPEKVTAWDVLTWTMNQTVLPEQKDPRASFGDPPITLYTAPRFHIDVYFWFEGTTATHQHAFCGAFQVLHGSSIHSWYEWKRRESVNTFTETGDMELKVCELLEVGDVQPIWAGKRYIHALFHLDQPSATVVVRTDKSPLYLPQYAYHKPHLAIDPFFEQIVTTKKLQSIIALLRAGHPDADARVAEVIESSDFQTTYLILSQVHAFLRSGGIDQIFGLARAGDRFGSFLDAARGHHGELGELLAPVFAHREKQDEIVRQRGTVTNPEHRFFLALLLNAQGRERIFGLIKKRFPESDPLEKVLDWVFDMSQTRIFGANPPNALGIADFDNFDLFVLENLLKGKSEEEMRESLRSEYTAEEAEKLVENLDGKIERIRRAVIFQPLLDE
jgi:hypothetical protein